MWMFFLLFSSQALGWQRPISREGCLLSDITNSYFFYYTHSYWSEDEEFKSELEVDEDLGIYLQGDFYGFTDCDSSEDCEIDVETMMKLCDYVTMLNVEAQGFDIHWAINDAKHCHLYYGTALPESCAITGAYSWDGGGDGYGCEGRNWQVRGGVLDSETCDYAGYCTVSSKRIELIFSTTPELKEVAVGTSAVFNASSGVIYEMPSYYDCDACWDIDFTQLMAFESSAVELFFTDVGYRCYVKDANCSQMLVLSVVGCDHVETISITWKETGYEPADTIEGIKSVAENCGLPNATVVPRENISQVISSLQEDYGRLTHTFDIYLNPKLEFVQLQESFIECMRVVVSLENATGLTVDVIEDYATFLYTSSSRLSVIAVVMVSLSGCIACLAFYVMCACYKRKESKEGDVLMSKRSLLERISSIDSDLEDANYLPGNMNEWKYQTTAALDDFANRIVVLTSRLRNTVSEHHRSRKDENFDDLSSGSILNKNANLITADYGSVTSSGFTPVIKTPGVPYPVSAQDAFTGSSSSYSAVSGYMNESWTPEMNSNRRRSFTKNAPISLDEHTSIPLPKERGILISPPGLTTPSSSSRSRKSLKQISSKERLTRREQVKRMLDRNRSGSIHHHYLLGKKIRMGKGESLHICTQRSNGQKVLARLIDKPLSQDDSTRLEAEIGVMARLQHPCLLRIKDVYENSFRFYIILDFVHRDLCDALIERGFTISEKEAKSFIYKILDAIEYLAERNINHLNLVAENIFIGERLTDICLSNYGPVKHIRPHGREKNVKRICYMPPEMLQKKFKVGETHSGVPCSMWMLGCVMSLVLLGHFPFDSESEEVIKQQILETNLSRAKWKRSGLAQDLLLKMLNKNPAMRITPVEAKKHAWFRGVQWQRPVIPKKDVLKIPDDLINLSRVYEARDGMQLMYIV